MDKLEVVVSEDSKEQRLDIFLTSIFKENDELKNISSRAKIQEIIIKNCFV